MSVLDGWSQLAVEGLFVVHTFIYLARLVKHMGLAFVNNQRTWGE